MADLTVKEFIDVVHRSHLIDKDQLIGALSECKANGALPEEAEEVADFLQHKGLITQWQQRNLLLGKSRGFYLGDYCLLNHLGTGGMSSVFLAKHQLIDRMVAIKVLPSAKVQDSSFLERFEREAQATSRLSHPNIVRVFDIDEQDGTHFMVMEYVSGRDLKEIVKAEGRLPLERAAHYIAQTAVGLQHAHNRGLVHRDIKPANLVVNQDDVVKILDLGLARLDNDNELASLTVANAEMMGTADYLAPEQAINAHTVDQRADIYSLGCTFYFLLTGHAPFTDGTIAQRILLHQTEMPPDVRAIRDDCPHAVADVCMRMLAKSPADRLQSGGIIASRLDRWLQTRGFPTEAATYASGGELIQLPIATASNPQPIGPMQDATESLTDMRRRRSQRQVRTPIGLWIFLGLSVLVCVALVVFVVMRNS